MAKKKSKTLPKRSEKRTPKDKAASRKKRRLILRWTAVALLMCIVMGLTYVLVIRKNEGDVSIMENGIGSAANIAVNALHTGVDKVKDFFQHFRDYSDLEDEYLALKRENQQMKLQLTAAEETAKENERLTGLVNAYDRYTSLDPIYAKVIARDPGQWFYTFSINRGSEDGIPKGATVVTGDGLIGRITDVGSYYSKVVCIIDARSRLACLIQRTRDSGILQGQSSETGDSAECYVYYLPNLNNISPGDTVVTSGTDSLFPKGIKIGTVTAVCLDAGSDGSYAVITPSVDFQHIEEVIVLRDAIETDSDVLPSSVSYSSGESKHIIKATPTPSPTPAASVWAYPTNDAGDVLQYEPLPEDDWARG